MIILWLEPKVRAKSALTQISKGDNPLVSFQYEGKIKERLEIEHKQETLNETTENNIRERIKNVATNTAKFGETRKERNREWYD